jgi:hypothetical protein
MAVRVAGLWGMIAELDPAIAARLQGYGPDAGQGHALMPAPGPW